jgi:hypothetical protein
MAAQDMPKGARTSTGFDHDAAGGRRSPDGTVKRTVWFEALPAEWQAIIDEDTDPGHTTFPMK